RSAMSLLLSLLRSFPFPLPYSPVPDRMTPPSAFGAGRSAFGVGLWEPTHHSPLTTHHSPLTTHHSPKRSSATHPERSSTTHPDRRTRASYRMLRQRAGFG